MMCSLNSVSVLPLAMKSSIGLLRSNLCALATTAAHARMLAMRLRSLTAPSERRSSALAVIVTRLESATAASSGASSSASSTSGSVTVYPASRSNVIASSMPSAPIGLGLASSGKFFGSIGISGSVMFFVYIDFLYVSTNFSLSASLPVIDSLPTLAAILSSPVISSMNPAARASCAVIQVSASIIAPMTSVVLPVLRS